MSAKGKELLFKAAAGEAPWGLLYCPQCPDLFSSSYEQDFRFSWSLKLNCSRCHTSWWACRVCPGQRSHLRQPSQLSRHNRIYHKHPPTPTVIVPTGPPNPPTPVTKSTPSGFPFVNRATSRDYFLAACNGNGDRYLISNAIGQSSSMSNFDSKDIDMMMSLSHFVTTLTRKQRDQLATVLLKTTESSKRHYEFHLLAKHAAQSPRELTIPVPTTPQQLRSIFSDGQRALLTNLPHPEIMNLGDHAYILPSECVADLLAHGSIDTNPTNSIHPVQSLANSRVAVDIRAKNDEFNCKSIFLSLWSDDFEPNYSKGNRGSVWICTLTIQTAESGNPRIDHVYPLAVGPKGKDHQEVMRIILNDIRNLSRKEGCESSITMYHGRNKQDIKISAHLICLTQDQPERRGFSGLLLGGKGHHSRWGWSLNLVKVHQKMTPCDTCFSNLRKFMKCSSHVIGKCGTCYNFWTDPNQISFPVEEDYPSMEPEPNMMVDTANQRMQPCKQLSFSILKEAVKLAHEKIVSDQWSKKTARAYLNSVCINKQSQDDILLCATNVRVRQIASEENNVELVTACEMLRIEEPAKHDIWTYPPIWDSALDMQQVTEPCMHLLFLGLMKNVTFEIQEWSALRNKYSAMRAAIEKMTTSIERLHLGWCKVQPYKGEKLGGWVSENFLGFARISPWVYSCLQTLKEDVPFVPDGDRPIARWTTTECKTFLGQRRLPRTGTAIELRQRVRENYGVAIPTPIGGTVEQVQELVVCQWQMNSFLLGMESLDKSDLPIALSNALIRLFLRSLSIHDKSTGIIQGRDLPIWVTQYNCQCLLNVPEQLKLLGPIRNRWEGGQRGEAFLRTVKPVVQSGRKNWQKNLFLNLLRQKTLMQMIQSTKVPEGPDLEYEQTEDDSMEQTHEPQSFVVYPSLADVVNKWAGGGVISALMVDSDLFACYRFGSKRDLVEFKIVEDSAIFISGMWYHGLEYTNGSEENPVGLGEIRATCYAILLPLKYTNRTAEQEVNPTKYALITSNWMTWDTVGKLVQPYKYLSEIASLGNLT